MGNIVTMGLFALRGERMEDYAPGMRVIIRDEEWMIKKVETNSLGKRQFSAQAYQNWLRTLKQYFLPILKQLIFKSVIISNNLEFKIMGV